jgi:uncharacterized protein (DUF2384 family)
MAAPEQRDIPMLAALLDRAAEVFSDPDVAHEWMMSFNPGLGGATPLAHAETESGRREIEQFLGRIECDVYS